MNRRLFKVLFCLLLLGLTSLPAWAIARPETRVGGSPAFSSVFASQETAKPIGTPSENPSCGYDFAAGVHNYQYNLRGHLTSESLGLNSSTPATNAYTFDSSLLGVLVGAQWSGGLTNAWQGSLDAFSQVTPQSWNEANLTLRANGSADNVGSLSASLDASSVSSTLNDGRWFSDLTLLPGTHSLAASAYYPAGQFTLAVTNSFSVLGTNNVTDAYDLAGNVTNRVFASGKKQALTWDAAGRLVALTQWNNSTNGFFWTAIYDALGRRLRTIEVPVVNGYTNTVMTQTLDSYFDPGVEFEEVGVDVNGRRTWKVLGPDLNGQYGSMQGVGGLESTVRESDGLTVPVLNDYLGNVLATISGTSTTWNPMRVTGYGPALGYQASTLTPGTPLADTLVWRSRGIDPSGFYNLGARYYDPMAGHFLSADPLGHVGSMDLQSFCDGDPINMFDPTGRVGKSIGGGFAGIVGLGGRSSMFREDLLQLDVAYEDEVDDTLITVASTAVLFAVPEIAAALLDEGFAAEAGTELLTSEGLSGVEGVEESTAVQTEFGFVGQVEEEQVAASLSTKTALPTETGGLSESAGSVETSEQVTLSTGDTAVASETANSVPQAEQSELNFNGAGNGAAAEGGIQTLDATAIRFSQSSVNNAGAVVDSMAANGWQGAPVTVVRMADGGLTTVDNTRVLAAGLTGTPVQATIMDAGATIDASQAIRFVGPNGNLPSTWGEAVLNRIGNQNNLFRTTYPSGSPFTGLSSW